MSDRFYINLILIYALDIKLVYKLSEKVLGTIKKEV